MLNRKSSKKTVGENQKVAARQKRSVSNYVATVDAENPIPFEQGGRVFHYSSHHAYVPFLAPKNDYDKVLLAARLLSNTHNSIISRKKNYLAGEGFQDFEGKELTDEMYEWFKCMNRRGQSLIPINRSIFESLLTYGNAPIELVRLSVNGKKHLFIYPHNFLEWRKGEPDDYGVSSDAIQSKLFRTKAILTKKDVELFTSIPIYNPMRSDNENWKKDEKGAERTIIWYQNDVTGFDHYGLPSSNASLIYQILEYKAARFNLDNLDNNMVLGGILVLKGALGDTEAQRIAKNLINTHTGDGKRGRIAVTASEEGEGIDSSSFHQFNSARDGSFKESDEMWSQKIIVANDWDATLMGLQSSSTLGKGSGFYTKALENLVNSVIRPAQAHAIEGLWSHIFKIAEKWMGLPFSNYDMIFRNTIDISGLTDVDITGAIQVNEVREAKGLGKDPKMDGVYMSKANEKQSMGGGTNVQD